MRLGLPYRIAKLARAKPLGTLAASVNLIRIWTAMIYVKRPGQLMHGQPTPQPVFAGKYLQCTLWYTDCFCIFIVCAVQTMLNTQLFPLKLWKK